MLQYKSGQLSKTDTTQINSLLNEIVDIFGDFYITCNNLRLFLRENPHLLYEGIKKGNKIVWGDEGIILVDGFADNFSRKYIKILALDSSNAEKLLKILNWNLTNETLYAKVKKNNPILKTLQKNGFQFVGDRGKEILLCRTPNIRKNSLEGDK